MGTGSFNILMDTDFLLPSEETREKVTAMYSYFPDLNPERVPEDKTQK